MVFQIESLCAMFSVVFYENKSINRKWNVQVNKIAHNFTIQKRRNGLCWAKKKVLSDGSFPTTFRCYHTEQKRKLELNYNRFNKPIIIIFFLRFKIYIKAVEMNCNWDKVHEGQNKAENREKDEEKEVFNDMCVRADKIESVIIDQSRVNVTFKTVGR